MNRLIAIDIIFPTFLAVVTVFVSVMTYAFAREVGLKFPKINLKKYGRPLIFLGVGFALGLGLMASSIRKVKIDAAAWQDLQADTRESWLQDRRDWRDGKPFEPHYGRHGARW